jgi:hypothetical protein
MVGDKEKRFEARIGMRRWLAMTALSALWYAGGMGQEGLGRGAHFEEDGNSRRPRGAGVEDAAETDTGMVTENLR